jgi:chitodextrinase
MHRDASQAWANGRYDAAMKAALVAAGGTGFTYPACSAPAWVSGTGYPAGSQVTYNGYIWQSKWYADDAPAAVFTGDWNPSAYVRVVEMLALTGAGAPVSACGGAPVPPSSTKTTSTPTPTPTPTSKPGTTTTKSSSSSSSPGGGSCAGVAAWSSATAYTGGTEATYGGYLWQAKWWTQADTPGTPFARAHGARSAHHARRRLGRRVDAARRVRGRECGGVDVQHRCDGLARWRAGARDGDGGGPRARRLALLPPLTRDGDGSLVCMILCMLVYSGESEHPSVVVCAVCELGASWRCQEKQL